MKKVSVIIAVILLLSATVYGTQAYRVVDDRATSVITTGGVKIRLVEVTEDGSPFPESGIYGVCPGAEESKIVTVKNTGPQPAWVRLETRVEIALDPAHGGGEPDTTLVKPDYDTESWEFRDGFYYYKDLLEPGEETPPLFTKVKFDVSMDNKYQGSHARVRVTAYAVQSQHNGSTVLEARGWPAAQ